MNCSIPLGSAADHGYKFCGKHWPLNKLPINFRLNFTGAKPDGDGFERAAILAAEEWDSIAPVRGTGSRTKSCLPSTNIICISEFTLTGGVTPTDGINTVVWSHLGAAGPLGQTWITADSAGTISDVDIEMNLDVRWFHLTDDFGVGAATGVAAGILGGICDICAADKFDVQGVLAHEFGHALGLEHVGGPPYWPSKISDAPDYTMIMYEMMYPNSSVKRIAGWGDALGLQRAMFYTMSGQ